MKHYSDNRNGGKTKFLLQFLCFHPSSQGHHKEMQGHLLVFAQDKAKMAVEDNHIQLRS